MKCAGQIASPDNRLGIKENLRCKARKKRRANKENI